jgi:hypothetical protein
MSPAGWRLPADCGRRLLMARPLVLLSSPVELPPLLAFLQAVGTQQLKRPPLGVRGGGARRRRLQRWGIDGAPTVASARCTRQLLVRFVVRSCRWPIWCPGSGVVGLWTGSLCPLGWRSRFVQPVPPCSAREWFLTYVGRQRCKVWTRGLVFASSCVRTRVHFFPRAWRLLCVRPVGWQRLRVSGLLDHGCTGRGGAACAVLWCWVGSICVSLLRGRVVCPIVPLSNAGLAALGCRSSSLGGWSCFWVQGWQHLCVVSLAYVCGAWGPWRVAPSTVGISSPLRQLSSFFWRLGFGNFVAIVSLAWFPASCTACPWSRMNSPSVPVRRATNLVVIGPPCNMAP